MGNWMLVRFKTWLRFHIKKMQLTRYHMLIVKIKLRLGANQLGFSVYDGCGA